MPAQRNTEIIDFKAEYANAFRDLNVEWLEKFFRVEPIDHEILGDPAGFEHAEPPAPSDYERADVYMILRDTRGPTSPGD